MDQIVDRNRPDSGQPGGLDSHATSHPMPSAQEALGLDVGGARGKSGITIVVVEHIMEVIVSLAQRVVVFHQGREIARGTPREVTSNSAVIEAYLGRRKVRH